MLISSCLQKYSVSQTQDQDSHVIIDLEFEKMVSHSTPLYMPSCSLEDHSKVGVPITVQISDLASLLEGGSGNQFWYMCKVCWNLKQLESLILDTS